MTAIGEPTDFACILGTGTWLREAATALRFWMDGRPDRQDDLGWLADGLDLGAEYLLDIAKATAEADPFTELIRGDHPRH